MFNVVKNGTNRLEIDFSGKLNSDEMTVALDELFDKSTGIEHGRMLYRIGDFDIPTLGAIAVELSRLPDLFRLIRNFDKAAVLASQKWVRAVSNLEGTLIPGLEIKAFELDNASEAEAWLVN